MLRMVVVVVVEVVVSVKRNRVPIGSISLSFLM